MDSIEVDNNRIKQIFSVFKIIGFWDGENGTAFNKKKFSLFIFYASFPISLASGALINGDKEDSTYLTAMAIAVVVEVVRLFYIIWRESDIVKLIQENNVMTIEDREDLTRVNNKVKNLMKFSLYLILVPVITNKAVLGYYIIKGDRTLPVKIGFPLDWKKNEIGYWLAFSYTAVELTFSEIITLLNILIWNLMLNFSLKYELLGNHFRRMGTIKRTEFSVAEKGILLSMKCKNSAQNLFLQDLIAGIKSHRNTRQ